MTSASFNKCIFCFFFFFFSSRRRHTRFDCDWSSDVCSSDLDADQRGNELIRQRREQFQAALTARTDSPLGRPFWRNLRAAAPLDAARLQGLGRELRQAVASTMASDRRGGFIASLAAALLIALLGQIGRASCRERV